MACENPISIRNPAYAELQNELFWREYYRETYGYCGLPDEFIEVPCGRCLGCRKDKQNGWRIRLKSELERYPHSLFITLTFDDFNLRKFKGNPNKAVRLFLDRCRKTLKIPSMRHFIIGEYGEKTNRFHYHGILFNSPSDLDGDKLSEIWKYGFCYVGKCQPGAVNYIIKYITKDSPKHKSMKMPRIIASHGIGAKFVDDYKDEPLVTNLNPFLSLNNGGKLKLPRYLIDKLFDIEDKVIMKIINSGKPFERYLRGVKYTDPVKFKQDRNKLFLENVSNGLSDLPPEKPRFTNEHLKPLKSLKNDPFDTSILNYYEYMHNTSVFDVENLNPF